MSESTKSIDYARLVADSTTWADEEPVMEARGWSIYTTERIDFRIVVTQPDQRRIVMGIQTWAVLTAAGFASCLGRIQRAESLLDYADCALAEEIPWDHLADGMRKLGWVERDPLARLVDDANRLLRTVGSDGPVPEAWWTERATEYARICEQRERYAQSLDRLDSLLMLVEDRIEAAVA